MTDFEVVLDLLARAGVAPIEVGQGYESFGKMRPDWVTLSTQRLYEDTKVTGYSGFYTDWTFDERGTLVEMGAWE